MGDVAFSPHDLRDFRVNESHAEWCFPCGLGPRSRNADAGRIFRLPLQQRHDFRFHDDITEREDRRPPNADDVAAVISMGTELAADSVDHLLVHCWAGMSRSTSIAMTLMAQASPGREAEIPDALLSVRTPAWPNSRIIDMADAQLGAEGRLIAAKEEVFRRVVRNHPQMIEMMENFNRGHEIPRLSA